MRKPILFLLLLATLTTYSQKRKFGKIKKAELTETAYEKDSLCDAVFLYKKRSTSLEFQPQSFTYKMVTKIHNVVKLYNTDGFDNATHTINYYSPEEQAIEYSDKVQKIKAFTYNLENGKIIKTKLNSDDIFQNQKNKYRATKKFTMPNIKAGSIVEYSYTVSSIYWGINDLNFQYGIPVKQLHYTIRIPEYFNYTQRATGYYTITPETEVTTRVSPYGVNNNQTGQGDRHNITYTRYIAEDIPALRDNGPYISNINNYRGSVKYELSSTFFPGNGPKSYSNTWVAVSEKIFESQYFGAELKKSNYFKKDLEVLLKDKTTDSEKITAIFNFVKSKVKWNDYNGKYTDKGVRKAYEEGTGNVAEINLMLVSMLREAGLTANPVLLSTRDNGIPFFPTRSGFNYVIAAVSTLNSGYILLDATEEYSSPDNLPLRDLNWNGRMIAADGRSSQISLDAKNYSVRNNTLTVSIDSEQNINGMLQRKLTGLAALNYREKNNKTKEEDLIENLENKYNAEISNFRIGNKEEASKPLSQLIQFEVSDMVEEINDQLYINPLFFFTTDVNPFKLDERIFPVDFGAPWKEKNKISIKIPEGYKVESIPESFGIGLPDNLGVYKFQIKASNSMISIISIEQMNTSVISPDYYNDLKDFYNQVVAKTKDKIVLSRI